MNELEKVTRKIHRAQKELSKISLDYPTQREQKARHIQSLLKWQARLYQGREVRR